MYPPLQFSGPPFSSRCILLCVSLRLPRQETHRFSIDTVQRKCASHFLGKQCSFRLCTVTLVRGVQLGGFLKSKLPTDGRKFWRFVCAASERSASLLLLLVSRRLSTVSAVYILSHATAQVLLPSVIYLQVSSSLFAMQPFPQTPSRDGMMWLQSLDTVFFFSHLLPTSHAD